MKIKQFKLEKFFEEYEFNVPFVLCASDCESMSIGELLDYEKLTDLFNNQWLGYTEIPGRKQLRNEISKLYSSIDLNEIVVHSGAEEAIFIIMNTCLNRGDNVIVHTPCYQSLREIPVSIGCQVTEWKSNPKDGWELDLNFLKKNIRKNTRMIILNCPHNPTGYLMDKKKFYEVIDIVKSKNIILFSDEVYRLLEYDKDNRLPSACDLTKNAVSLGVMSKSFGLAGLRIGWIATKNKDIIRNVVDYKSYTTICNSAPSEYLSIIGLKYKEQILERNLKIIQCNIDKLECFINKYSGLFEWVKPKAGAIAFPKVKIKYGAGKFYKDLVKSEGVLLLPGKVYDCNEKYFRIGFGRKNFSEGLLRLENFIITKKAD